VEVILQAKKVAMTAREPTTPPPHSTATAAACGFSINMETDTATAPPTSIPAMKAERKTTERRHIGKKGGGFNRRL
jgi:hypothetical protein